MHDKLLGFLNSLGEEDMRFLLDAVTEKGALKPLGKSGPGRAMAKAPCPAKTFEVPADVKHLDPAQLLALTEAFRAWHKAASSPDRKRSRARLWLLFLLIRYGALKLGEATAVDDRFDFDFTRSELAVRGEHARTLKLPKDVSREIAKLLDDPVCASIRGEVFRLDQGFVRRKFYDRADECGVPRERANPSVLRHSRAVELLREGIPLKIVQSILGLQSMNLTAQYVSFSEDDIKRIVNFYILKETAMKTSARNSFTGKVTGIRQADNLAEVEVTTPSGIKVVSVITQDSYMNLGIKEGLLVTATVKAPWVILVKEDMKLKTSARNRYCGKIVKIHEGQLSAEVVVELADGTKVCSLITDESVRKLKLKTGDGICVLFKAFSVILNVE